MKFRRLDEIAERSVKEVRKTAFARAETRWWDVREEVQALEGDFAAPDAPEPGTEPGTPSNGGPGAPPNGGPAAASGDDEDQPPAR